MIKLVCADFDEFQEALIGVQGRYVLRGKQQRDWRLRIVDLSGVALMTGREGAGTVYRGVGLPKHYNMFLPLSGHETTVVDGHRFDDRHIGWMVPDAAFHIDASRPASWMTVAISDEQVVHWAQMHEDEFDFSTLDRNVVNESDRIAPLVHITRRLIRISSELPNDLSSSEAASAARAELIDAAFRALLPIEKREKFSRRRGDRRKILRTALGLIESLETAPVYLQDLCGATGASERTIRSVFHEYLGMSPHRYLMIHRLHLIRDAIRRASPGDSITAICARFGVWDFGRLAAQYQSYFGMLPSQSLYGRKPRPRTD